MPLRLDVGRSCSGGCKYCYVRSRSGNYVQASQFTNPKIVNRYLDKATDRKAVSGNAVIECLRKRVPLHFGGMSDPFLLPDSYQYISLEILKTLDKHKYPTLISTKADILRNKDVLKTISGKPHFALQISFSTFDDKIARFVEPGAPRPSKRLEGARRAIDGGTWVACRLQPFFPNQNIDSLVCSIKSHGFKHITIEHFKLPIDGKIDLDTLNLFNIDMREMFPEKKRIRRGREWEMPIDLRFNNVISFLNAAKKYHIPIGIGDNGLQHFSSTDCCCGIDSLPGFGNWLKHNSLVAVQRARLKGQISYRAIADEWAPNSDISRMINSKTRLKSVKNTIKNQIREQWAKNSQFSPTMFYGVLARKTSNRFIYYLNQNARGEEV